MKLPSLAKDLYENHHLQQLLTEANVANVKDKIGSTLTLIEYLRRYAEGLATDESKTMFIKKLTTLLMNDPRNLHALREVPPNAPEWAIQAVQTGQLMVFIPDETLNDKVQHIVHYLSAAEQDSQQQANNDQRVFAIGELKGFSKIGTFDLIEAKANEYFKRGTRNVKRDISGMEQVFDAGDGYVWYELKDAAAYQREGKILQNCIGKFYTPEMARKTHDIIFVLRDAKDNSVVAARIHGQAPGYVLQEVKGKQNKPPVDEYMPPTIKFVNKMKFQISDAAKRDLINAGYFYIDNEFMDRTTAIKKHTETKTLTTIDGFNLVRVMGNHDIMQSIYKNTGDFTVYEARTKDNDSLFSFLVRGGSLIKVSASKEGNANINVRNDMINYLMDHREIGHISDEVQKQLFWQEKPVIHSQQTKRIEPIAPNKEHQLSPDENKWDEYTDPTAIDEVTKIISLSGGVYGGEKQTLDQFKRNVKQIYVMHGGEKKLLFVVLKNDQVFPALIQGGELSFRLDGFGFKGNSWERDERIPKDVKSLISFANDKRLIIPDSICKHQGIVVAKDGEYTQFMLRGEKISDNPPVVKYDFSDITPESKNAAVWFATAQPEIKQGTERNNLGKSDFGDLSEKNVDALYRIDVTYGVDKPHKFVIATQHNTIVDFNESSKQQSWQGWNDFDIIADKINAVVKRLGLKFAPGAASNSYEFKIVGGELSTKSRDIKKTLEKKKMRGSVGTEGTDELPFADGSKLKKLDSTEQAKWMRQSLNSSASKGEAWYIEKPNGTKPYAYFVDNKKITRTLITRYLSEPKRYGAGKLNELPTATGYNQESLKYLKGACDVFGWRNVTPAIIVTPKKEDSCYKDLANIYASHKHTLGYHEIHKEIAVQRLVRFGLVKKIHVEDEDDKFENVYWVQVTPAGEEALKKLRAGETIDGLTHISGKPVSDTFKKPEKQSEKQSELIAAERPKQEHDIARVPRAEGGETKADMAVRKFREFQTEHGRVPSGSEFRTILMAPPFNMTPAGAGTYYHTTKKKVAAGLGEGCHLALAYDDLFLTEMELPLLQQLEHEHEVSTRPA